MRGQRTQQRILEAALEVFGEVGYHQCGIARGTDAAGCTRASFYQSFSSTEDVFRHLAGQVGRQLIASAEALEPITAQRAGWESVRAWVARHAEIQQRYQPVFQAFQAATESDEAVAAGSVRILGRHVATVRSKVVGSSLTTRQLDATVELMLHCMTRTPHVVGVLRAGLPEGTLAETRIHDSLADLFHRALFGVDLTVNVQEPSLPAIPRMERAVDILVAMTPLPVSDGLSPAGARTLEALLVAARGVLLTRGYHGTRVDDVTDAAGLSHGAFYRYFDNKSHLVRILAIRSMQRMAEAFREIPTPSNGSGVDTAALRRWLRRYAGAHADEAAMIRVLIDATVDEPALLQESAAALDWGRARLVRLLAPRGFGDVEVEAVLIVVLLDAIGALRENPDCIDAAAHLVETALLGMPIRA